MQYIKIISFLPSASKSKGKAIPLQAWTSPEGSRRLRLPDFEKVVASLSLLLPPTSLET
jgi:hypothetical protein